MMLSRRHLLAGAALLLLWPRGAVAAATDQTEAMLALLPDRNAAAKLGATWVQQERKQPSEVLQSLQHRLSGDDAGKLRDAIAEDFHSGAVVKIEGWQIARTQAELCALAYFVTTGSL
jgi:hypothetical protein